MNSLCSQTIWYTTTNAQKLFLSHGWVKKDGTFMRKELQLNEVFKTSGRNGKITYKFIHQLRICSLIKYNSFYKSTSNKIN